FGQPPLSEAALIKSAQFTQHELPIRLARRIQAFQKLPFIVGLNPHIHAVYRLYFDAFEALRSFPLIENSTQEEQFSKVLKKQIENLTHVVPKMAQGFLECKKYIPIDHTRNFLNDLIRSRISLRLIGEQHVALHETSADYIGIIHTRLSPAQLIHHNASYVQNLCEINYNAAPEFVINGDTNTVVQYVPVHLEYIACELLKNAFRATAEFGLKHNAGRLQPIEITVTRGKRDICLRFRDQGGGVATKDLPHVFEYSYTTVPSDLEDSGADIGLDYTTKLSMQAGAGGPMAGLGYGLPMARIYARYFGGSLDLVSLEGYGCDVFLKLKNIDVAARD
ncbi:branched-chain alpha-ketoacid dehydrogenase, partial [Dimargaris cristalligena]